MPEATIYEHGDLRSGKYDVRAPTELRQRSYIYPVPQPTTVQLGPQSQFGRRITLADPAESSRGFSRRGSHRAATLQVDPLFIQERFETLRETAMALLASKVVMEFPGSKALLVQVPTHHSIEHAFACKD